MYDVTKSVPKTQRKQDRNVYLDGLVAGIPTSVVVPILFGVGMRGALVPVVTFIGLTSLVSAIRRSRKLEYPKPLWRTVLITLSLYVLLLIILPFVGLLVITK